MNAGQITTVLAVLFAAVRLIADGGSILLQKETDSVQVTVFAAPVPVRVGLSEFSVLVQKSRGGVPFLDADVNLVFSQAGHADIAKTAIRADATNKVLYAAPVVFPAPGVWSARIIVRSRYFEAQMLPGELAVLDAEQPLRSDWPYLVVPPLCVLFFIMNQRLKRRG